MECRLCFNAEVCGAFTPKFSIHYCSSPEVIPDNGQGIKNTETIDHMPAKISVQKADITKLKVDAIVNAANTSLLGGGGVDGAIHLAGGPAILEACIKIRDRQGGCAAGEAVITTGGNLPAKFVIHTVGPVWNNGNKNEAVLLANAYRNSMQLAVQNNIATIAFPNISTGIYHFPKQLAAEIAVAEIKKFAAADSTIEEVIFVCFDEENLGIYKELLIL